MGIEYKRVDRLNGENAIRIKDRESGNVNYVRLVEIKAGYLESDREIKNA